ncbi:MAG: hypothetical protein KGJ23_08840 [Euryarchaeota archaeon]|nr:hypothetical protein [Euryarchaeota archaeon]MDE1836710.1 hypothetical protein [Euryarchaeota archaeon]MDE1880261.1 hypothetical protein [Euryarchaeota archaeon]MDE2044680.1 hypothetical protein [Thermoplasmata archaeon]
MSIFLNGEWVSVRPGVPLDPDQTSCARCLFDDCNKTWKDGPLYVIVWGVDVLNAIGFGVPSIMAVCEEHYRTRLRKGDATKELPVSDPISEDRISATPKEHTHRIVHFCSGQERPGVQGGTCADPDCEVARLSVELTLKERKVKAVEQMLADALDGGKRIQDERDAARAEVERLREALGRIAGWAEEPQAKKVARIALGLEKPEPAAGKETP